MLRRMYDWVMKMASHKHADRVLFGVSFLESSVFPIPPDVMLMPMVLAQRHRAFIIAGICTVASILGGCLGYALGFYLYDWVGSHIVEFYHLEEPFANSEIWFQENGAWIVLLKGLTPVPYKLVTIAAGVFRLDPLDFIVASIVSRGGRFFGLAALFWKFGEPIREFVEKYLTLLTTLFAVLLVGGFVVVKYLV